MRTYFLIGITCAIINTIFVVIAEKNGILDERKLNDATKIAITIFGVIYATLLWPMWILTNVMHVIKDRAQ